MHASGPGGQNVNKVATAVQLRFDPAASGLPQDIQTRLRTIAGCGHLLIGERPDACLVAIEEFVASLKD